tara:strand:- start:104 stop:568 length:465 start_codon:yes stop_codon:yes gene_type:complete
MSIPPLPSGHDIYWEKWMDVFEEVDSDYAEEPLIDEDQFLESEYSEIEKEEQNAREESIIPVQGVMTPYGMLPITDDTLASRKFKFWVGHSNFRLTEDYYGIIGPVEGVETLDILTPYRFRIGVGKMFVDREVMTSVRDKMVSHVGSKKKSGPK